MSPELVARAKRERWARDLVLDLNRVPATLWFWVRHPRLSLAFYGWCAFPKYGRRV